MAPRQAGRPGEPRSDQSEAEFGAGLAFTYTHNREMGGGPLLVKKGGGFRLQDKQDVPGNQEGGQSEAEFGSALAFIYTHNREMGGGPLLVKKGGVWAVLGGFRLLRL